MASIFPEGFDAKRTVGGSAFPGAFEPGGQMPFDARLVVPTFAVLTDAATYAKNNYYAGMTVTVVEGETGKSELWTLLGEVNAEGLLVGKNPTVAANWQRLDADAAQIGDNITGAIEGLDYTDTAKAGEFVTAVNEVDGIISVSRGKVAADKVTATAIAASGSTVAVSGTNVAAQIANLGQTVKTVQDNAAKYKVVKVTEGLAANVKELYRVVSYTGDFNAATATQVGEDIVIYKDGQLKSVESSGDTNTVVTFTYSVAKDDGTFVDESFDVDLGKAIFESEMGNGIQVTDSKIAIKLDTDSEDFLTVGANGLKLSGVQKAIGDTIKTLDATVGSKTVASGKHVAVEVVETDGKLTGLTVTESDIASAQALQDVSNTIDAMDLATVGGTGKFVKSVAQTNGKVTAVAEDLTADKVALKESIEEDGVELRADSVQSALQALFAAMISNEEVSAQTIATLISTLGDSAIDPETGTIGYAYKGESSILKRANNFAHADELLANAIASLRKDMQVIDCGTY